MENIMRKFTLTDYMPLEFDETHASYKYADVKVINNHVAHMDGDAYASWPGTHKNVFSWVELENGKAVGWNENPARGWSFPVISYKGTCK